MKTDIDIILARYFGGNATENDMEELERWISSSPENQSEFDKMTELYAQLSGSQIEMPKLNIKHAKHTFMTYISEKTEIQPIQTKHIPFYKNWMFQAASIAFFILISLSVWKVYFSEHEIILTSHSTPKLQILPDSSQINLSKNSTISYSSEYGKINKTIKLNGEAKFIVGHAVKGTLHVQANETFIEDIGTVFDVKAYAENDYVSVKVIEGEVRFFTKDNNGVKLAANETGFYNRNTKTFSVLAKKTDAFHKGSMHIEFQGMMLSDAIGIISNAYKVKIKLADKSYEKQQITVNFDGEDVNIVLQIIAETLDLKVRKEGNIYLLDNNK
jgi:ferric-dicitrate binding protein FerR (iron transport regulator)